MTPEQTLEKLTHLENLHTQTREKLSALEQDTNLSPAGRDQQRTQILSQLREEADALQTELAAALHQRLDEIQSAVDREKNSFFDDQPATDQDSDDDPLIDILFSLENHARRFDLRARWNLLTAPEILQHYRRVLAQDDRPLIELYETEAPLLLASRGDSENQTALLAAVAQARSSRDTGTLQNLLKAQEQTQILLLRLQNALEILKQT